MPESPSYEQLRAENAELRRQVEVLTAENAQLRDRIAGLERRLGSDSSNSSQPPSGDAPWQKKSAKKRSGRGRSKRKPGKQPGAGSASRSLTDDPDHTVVIEPGRCVECEASLAEAEVAGRERRQVVDTPPAPAPEVTEYQRVSKICEGCGAVTVPGWDTGDECAQVVASPGSPVRIGPATLARCSLLTCGHFLPVARAQLVLQALTGIEVSTGFVAGVRGRAAKKLEKKFAAHLRKLLARAPVLHVDETPGRAAGGLSYVHVACTDYLTLMHTGDRSAATIDDGGVLPDFSGVLVRDGYAGYTHLGAATHAWCAAHLLRDLRSVADAEPDGQLWATAMATCLTDAHQAATAAREAGATALDPATLARIRSSYHGALARGTDDNHGAVTGLAADARRLIDRFTRYEDMILRFATDLAVPFTNNAAERSVRPVKLQQRTSGGCWRTLQGLADFAIVTSYLDTATKWGKDKLAVLHQLFTSDPWLPPALTPAE